MTDETINNKKNTIKFWFSFLIITTSITYYNNNSSTDYFGIGNAILTFLNILLIVKFILLTNDIKKHTFPVTIFNFENVSLIEIIILILIIPYTLYNILPIAVFIFELIATIMKLILMLVYNP